jgi:RHS repeat-associated protein
VFSITNNLNNNRSQAFTYDALNRLFTASFYGGSDQYGYDAWGNLLTKTVTSGSGEYWSQTADSNNRLQGWVYDGAGNLTNTPGGPYDNKFNAENQWTYQNTSNVSYLYDGDGRRVRSSGGASGTRTYWYDEAGNVLEESGTNGAEYFYLAGRMLVRNGSLGSYPLTYYYQDLLGTTRMRTDSFGNVCYDEDYFPWGGAQYVATNTCPQNYKFTGKEQDPDIGVDYFGARFYQDAMARFYSPDWSTTVEPVPYARLNNPQSLNLYTYALDNPTTLRDIDGHIEEGADTVSGGDEQAAPGSQAQNTQTNAKAATIFGETSGLSPALGPDHKPDPDSEKNLKDARENVGDVSDRNSNVYSHTPTSKELKNPQVREAWEASKDAARGSDGTKPGNYFFIRQDKVGNQKPPAKAGFGQGDPIREYGPFRNVGGGDVPKGSNTYVDIYDK